MNRKIVFFMALWFSFTACQSEKQQEIFQKKESKKEVQKKVLVSKMNTQILDAYREMGLVAISDVWYFN